MRTGATRAAAALAALLAAGAAAADQYAGVPEEVPRAPAAPWEGQALDGALRATQTRCPDWTKEERPQWSERERVCGCRDAPAPGGECARMLDVTLERARCLYARAATASSREHGALLRAGLWLDHWHARNAERRERLAFAENMETGDAMPWPGFEILLRDEEIGLGGMDPTRYERKAKGYDRWRDVIGRVGLDGWEAAFEEDPEDDLTALGERAGELLARLTPPTMDEVIAHPLDRPLPAGTPMAVARLGRWLRQQGYRSWSEGLAVIGEEELEEAFADESGGTVLPEGGAAQLLGEIRTTVWDDRDGGPLGGGMPADTPAAIEALAAWARASKASRAERIAYRSARAPLDELRTEIQPVEGWKYRTEREGGLSVALERARYIVENRPGAYRIGGAATQRQICTMREKKPNPHYYGPDGRPREGEPLCIGQLTVGSPRSWLATWKRERELACLTERTLGETPVPEHLAPRCAPAWERLRIRAQEEGTNREPAWRHLWWVEAEEGTRRWDEGGRLAWTRRVDACDREVKAVCGETPARGCALEHVSQGACAAIWPGLASDAAYAATHWEGLADALAALERIADQAMRAGAVGALARGADAARRAALRMRRCGEEARARKGPDDVWGGEWRVAPGAVPVGRCADIGDAIPDSPQGGELPGEGWEAPKCPG